MEHDGTPYCHISGIPKRSQKGLGLQRRHLGCPPQAWHSSSAHHRHGSVERVTSQHQDFLAIGIVWNSWGVKNPNGIGKTYKNMASSS